MTRQNLVTDSTHVLSSKSTINATVHQHVFQFQLPTSHVNTMEHAFQFLFFFMFITLSNAADILQNPDFEIPPLNISENGTSQFLLLHNKQNPIPGWSFNGTVWYVTPAANLALPGNGHAIRLGESGGINQTIRGTDDYSDYILTFTLAAQNENCYDFTAVNVSVIDYVYEDDRSQIFALGRNLSRQLWVSYGFHLGTLGRQTDSINLEIKSVAQNLEQNLTCWPVVDNFIVKRNGLPRWYEGNSIANGGFEIGPAVIKNSSEGILLNGDSSSYHTQLQQWKILGTVKYIDSKHFKIPRGNAAIELFSGYPCGIQADFMLQLKQTYTLNFTIGDANDSCVGDLLVFLQMGYSVWNYTVQSNGTGSASSRYSVTFSIASESSRDTSIVFYRFNETWATDGVLCGPVLDSISLHMSSSSSNSNSGQAKMELWYGFVIFSLVLGLIILV